MATTKLRDLTCVEAFTISEYIFLRSRYFINNDQNDNMLRIPIELPDNFLHNMRIILPGSAVDLSITATNYSIYITDAKLAPNE